MRFHRHDLRDFKLAFGLALDVRRIGHAGAALVWTSLVVIGVMTVLAWRIDAGESMWTDGPAWAIHTLLELPLTPGRAVYLLIALSGWWLGFAYLSSPILRSAAYDIARDEREKGLPHPYLCRQAAFAPAIACMPGAGALLLLLPGALLTHLPGDVGAGIAVLLLLPVTVIALLGALMLLSAVAAAPMMAPTAMVEGRDYFEAASRPVSYLIQQPGRYAVYMGCKLGVTLLAAALGLLVLGVTWGCAAGALWLVGPEGLVADVAAAARGQPSGSTMAMGLATLFWSSVVLVVAWLLVVALVCDLIVYLLMRYHCDGIVFSQIMVAREKLESVLTPKQTAEQAEEARKRHDAQQAVEPAPVAAAPEAPAN